MTGNGIDQPQRSQRLRVDRKGTVLHAELYGPEDAPLVAFTHGGWMDRRMFDNQVAPVVASGYRVLIWDVRGHGESLPRGLERPSVAEMGADLLAMLDAVGHAEPIPVFLVGQSLGGMISQHVALVAPERVAGLVTIGAPCINPVDQRLGKRMAAMWRISSFVNGLLPTSLVLRVLPKGTAVTPQAQEYVREVTQNSTKESFRWLIEASRMAGRELRGRSIDAPVLITRGAHDGSGAGRLTAMSAQDWVSRDPHARYVEIPEAGHQANQDRPEAFNELLLNFLDSGRQEPERLVL